MLKTKFPTVTPQDPKCQILSHIKSVYAQVLGCLTDCNFFAGQKLILQDSAFIILHCNFVHFSDRMITKFSAGQTDRVKCKMS